MKRHEAIAPLSRDHHGSLILAQLLKKDAPVYKGLPQKSGEKIAYAQQQFEAHIKKHFLQEEMILNKLAGLHNEIDDLGVTIKQEHAQLTGLFLSLDKTNPSTEAMDLLAKKLETHIRREERVLFPLLQQYCTAAMLAEIYQLLH